MKDHTNLSTKAKSILGQYADTVKRFESLIFEIESAKYKDYDKFASDWMYNRMRQGTIKRQISDLLESGQITQANIDLLNAGVYTGLINPNRLSYTAIYE